MSSDYDDLKKTVVDFNKFPPDLRNYMWRSHVLGCVISSGVSLASSLVFLKLNQGMSRLMAPALSRIITLMLAILYVYHLVIKPRLSFRALSELPTGGNFPFIGSLHMFDPDSLKLLNLIARTSAYVPGLGQIWAGPVMPLCIVSSAAAMKILMKEDPNRLPKMQTMKFLVPWLGDGLLTSSGEHWKIHRRIITPAFHFGALKSYHNIQVKHAKIFLQLLDQAAQDESDFDIVPLITYLTLDIISEAACGFQANSQIRKGSEYATAVHDACSLSADEMANRPFLPMTLWMWLPSGKRYLSAVNVCHRVCSEIITQKKAERLAAPRGAENAEESWNFLDILLDSAESDSESPQALTDKDILDEVNTFIFEGHDTTSVALSWLFFEIFRHPAVEQKIVEELAEVLGDRATPTFEDLKNLRYLEMCIKESLRLHPSVYIVGRKTTEDLELGEFTIPKGTEMVLVLYALHRNPTLWENPDLFDPERFSPENSKDRHPFAYLPFSAGSRNCIGQHFAMNQLKLVTSMVLTKFTMSVKNEKDCVGVPAIVMRMKSGLRVTTSRRTSPSVS